MDTISKFAVIFFSLLILSIDAKAAESETPQSGSAAEPGVVVKVERAVERGAKAAANGIERGAKAAAHGVERGVQATGRAANRVAKKIGGSSAPSSPSASEK